MNFFDPDDLAKERARQRMEEGSELGRVVWAMQDAEDEKKPRSMYEIVARRLVPTEESVAMPPVQQDYTFALDAAWRIAIDVHGKQWDKQGEPYLFHCVRVAMRLDGPTEYAAGLLHDTLEECKPEDREFIAERIKQAWGRTMVGTIWDLTRNGNEPYPDYLYRVARNPFAVKVKAKGDMPDNMSAKRLSKLPPAEQQRLYQKYETGLLQLYQFAQDAGTWPPNMPNPIGYNGGDVW